MFLTFKGGKYWYKEGLFLEDIVNPDYWLEPVTEPLYPKEALSKAWDAALAHSLHLDGSSNSFEEFVKTVKP